MNAPAGNSAVESEALSTSGRTQPPSLPSNDNRASKIGLNRIVTSLGLGAATLGVLGWLVHGYGIPATLSVWEEMIRPRVDNLIIAEIERSPRIHDFMVTEINNYLSGTIASTERPNETAVKLKALAKNADRIDVISDSLFGGVDSVYTISNEYELKQIKDTAKNTLSITSPKDLTTDPIRMFVYADPVQHCVWAYVQAIGNVQRGRRKERFSFDIKLNTHLLNDGDNVPSFDQEIGRYIRKQQGSGGGGREEDDANKTSTLIIDHMQKIEIFPNFPAFDPIQIVGPADNIPLEQPLVMKLGGYILVKRRPRLENKLGDCKAISPIASAANGND